MGTIQKETVGKVATILAALLDQQAVAGILVELVGAETNERLTDGEARLAGWLLDALMKAYPAASDQAADCLFDKGQALDRVALAEDLAAFADKRGAGR